VGSNISVGVARRLRGTGRGHILSGMVARKGSIRWLGHAGFCIEVAGTRVYIDPYRAATGERADLVLITHGHFDHFSPDDLEQLCGEGSQVIAPAAVTEQLKGPALKIAPGETLEFRGLDVTAVAAYNTNKLDSDGKPFHPREAGWVGYVIKAGGRKIYHSGDTDVIPEMDQAAGADIALLPVSGTYVMTAVEAAEAARRISPRIAVPMHWGTIIGTREDAEKFAELAPVEVRIPEKAGEAIPAQG
jgi:L-ascorbate metabolism protein UlaG (beta-lactamase superfamily)